MTKGNITISDLKMSPNSESFLTELKDTEWVVNNIIGGAKPEFYVEVKFGVKF